MMVAATDGRISMVNFETYFSIPATPRAACCENFEAHSGINCEESMAIPRSGADPSLWFQFDFQEDDLVGGLVEHVMLDAGLAEIGLSKPEPGLGTFAIRRHDGHLAGGHGHDHVIHFMDVTAGGAGRRQPPLGDADFRRIAL